MCRYKRLSPLVPLNFSLGGQFKSIRSGDCVVVFSREKLFRVRRKIETATKKPCAIIYGGLPSGKSPFPYHGNQSWVTRFPFGTMATRLPWQPVPSNQAVQLWFWQSCQIAWSSLPTATRVQQAELFNDSESHYEILVATDAIGMGLNL